MYDSFKIYIDRLKEGKVEELNETLEPSFIDIHEEGLSFLHPIYVKGEAELVQLALVLRLSVETEAIMNCAICNGDVNFKIFIHQLCHAEELSDIRGSIFDFREILREAILLELPMTIECAGNCPEREKLSIFFTSRKKEDPEEYYPFEGLKE